MAAVRNALFTSHFAALLIIACASVFAQASEYSVFSSGNAADDRTAHRATIAARDGWENSPPRRYTFLPTLTEQADRKPLLGSHIKVEQMREVQVDEKTRPAYSKEVGRSVLSWEPPAGKSYLIPAVEIVGFNLALNGLSRLLYPDEETKNGKKTYDTDFSTFWDHLIHGPWQTDNDHFRTNQLLHPYLGTAYQGFARSTGLNFWESMGYTFLGSFLWETAGENDNPSINDQVASGIAGNFLGEPLFRMANLLLEGRGEPGFWRELGAVLISPSAGFNRLAFGERFNTVFPSHNPATFWRLDLGASVNVHSHGIDTSDLQHSGATAAFSMNYGLPGKPGYHYKRPFDYFKFDVAVATTSSNAMSTVTSRGLLLGSEYEIGDAYKGIWGLYGTYDYLWPNDIRVSSTAVSLGTTAQWWLTNRIALQGSLLGGVGYGAGGDIRGYAKRDYHYGGTAQGVMDLRLILGDRAMLDVSGRGYYVSDVVATDPQGSEAIARLDIGLTVRIHGQHALAARYLSSWRDTNYRGLENQSQRADIFTLVYTFLSDKGFGAVQW